MATEAEKRATKKYDKENTVQVLLKLNKKTDKDILYELGTKYSKMGYIKDLIRKDIKSMIEERKAELAKWNEEQAREDTMYELEVRRYNRYGEEVGGDPIYAMSDDLEEIEKAFEKEIYYKQNQKGFVIELLRFTGVYDNTPEYESIKKFSTLD